MAVPGVTTRRYLDRAAGNLLRLTRIKTGLSQRALAAAAGVPRSTIGRIESGAMQPTFALLNSIIIAADLDMRIHLEPYDDHDDVLDNLDALDPERAARFKRGGEQLDAALAAGKPSDDHDAARPVLSLSELTEAVRGDPPPTADDVSITFDGRRLDSKEKVLAFFAEVEADQVKAPPVDL